MVILNGVSTNCFLVPGTKINVQDKTLHEDFGTYIITSVTHSVGQGGDYSNSFEAVPVELKIPPLSGMPAPPFCETQLGVVQGVDDPEGLGRVQVTLIWQDEHGDVTPMDSSCVSLYRKRQRILHYS